MVSSALFARAVAAAVGRVPLELLDAGDARFLLLEKAERAVPLSGLPCEGVCPILVNALLDKRATASRLRPETSGRLRIALRVSLLETVGVVDLLVEPLEALHLFIALLEHLAFVVQLPELLLLQLFEFVSLDLRQGLLGVCLRCELPQVLLQLLEEDAPLLVLVFVPAVLGRFNLLHYLLP